MNLALSLLLYQSLLFSAAKTDDQDTCLAIAVLLHFFVLSSFTWMNVMAYDVRRIFTTSGKLGVVNLFMNIALYIYVFIHVSQASECVEYKPPTG